MGIEIGPTLREARIRAELDVGTVEEDTKIRAKFLRALESEDWDLLPAPSYARSFLRTYAQYLGLDAEVIVEEYRSLGGPEEEEIYAFREPTLASSTQRGRGRGARALDPRREAARNRGRGTRAGPGGGIIAIAVLLGLFGLLFVIGTIGGDGDDEGATPPGAVETTEEELAAQRDEQRAKARAERRRERERERQSQNVRLRLTADANVWVCLLDATDKQLIGGEVLAAGTKQSFNAKQFRVTFGNGNVTMRVNGENVDVPRVAEPIAYEVTPRRTRKLDDAKRPTCS